jgi:hypothetical protein
MRVCEASVKLCKILESLALEMERMANIHEQQKRDPQNCSFLLREWQVFKGIKELMAGPHEQIPEAVVRSILGRQYGISPEEVTWEQIQFEVSALLPHYPAITLVRSDPIPPGSNQAEESSQAEQSIVPGADIGARTEAAPTGTDSTGADPAASRDTSQGIAEGAMADNPFSDPEINRQIEAKILRLQAASLEWDDNPDGRSFDDHIVETAVESLNAHAEPILRKVDCEDRKNQYVRYIRGVGSALIRNAEERGFLSDPYSEERLRQMAENSGSFMNRIRSLTPEQQETEILNEIERLRGEFMPKAEAWHRWRNQIRSRIETRYEACYRRWEADAIERLPKRGIAEGTMADHKHLLGGKFFQSVLPPASWKRIKAQKGQAVAELLEGLCGYWRTTRFSLVELQQHEPSELIPFFELYAERQFEAYAEELLAHFTSTVADFEWRLATDVIDVISGEIRPRQQIVPEDPVSKDPATLARMLRDLEPGSEEQRDLAKWLSDHSGDWEIYLQRSFRRQAIKAGGNVPARVTLLFDFKYVYYLRIFMNSQAFDLRLRAHLSNRLAFWEAKAYLQLPEQSESKSPIDQSASPASAPLPNGGNRAKRGADWNAIEVTRRADLLAAYKRANSNPSNKRIYEARNSGIHKPQFYEWVRGELPADSETTGNFERFLKEQKPPIARKPRA